MSRFSALLSLSLATVVLAAAVQRRDIALQKRATYTQVFDGTGTDPSDRDASLQGQGYLTFTRLDTWDLSACEAWCDGIAACAFVNLFDEFNSDATYNPQHKCVAYAYPQDASLKTNWGGQQLLPPPAGVTYVQNSVGYTSDSFENPATPPGYELIFGPTNGANEADDFLAGHSLSSYDVQGCANICSTTPVDDQDRVCVYFNIWLGVQNGNPTYTCALFGTATDASTATDYGQGTLEVTNSRGYTRVNILPDGGFEDYNPGGSLAYTEHTGGWSGTSGDDATIWYFTGDARTGHSAGLLGSAAGSDLNLGTLSWLPALNTIAGQQYTIGFWEQSTFPNPTQTLVIEVLWNGATVLSLTPGYQSWTYYQVTVTAAGFDHFAVRGGPAYAWGFVDDITIMIA